MCNSSEERAVVVIDFRGTLQGTLPLRRAEHEYVDFNYAKQKRGR